MSKKIFLFGSLALISCGDGSHQKSYTKDVSAPEEQGVGTVREFWFFESQADCLGQSTFKLKDSDFSYFPEAFPLENDFFWTAGSDILSRAEFGQSWDPQIQRAVPQFKRIDLKGNIFSINMHSQALARTVLNRNWRIDFQPTFRVRSVEKDIHLQLKFTIQNVCYNSSFYARSSIPENLAGLVIEDSRIEVPPFTQSLSDTSPELAPIIEYRPKDVKDFLNRCRSKGGELASAIFLELNGETKGADLEFSGIKTEVAIYADN